MDSSAVYACQSLFSGAIAEPVARYRKLELKCVVCRRVSGQSKALVVKFRDLGGAEVEACCEECWKDQRRLEAWKKENWRD
jgi:hypothetical protein